MPEAGELSIRSYVWVFAQYLLLSRQILIQSLCAMAILKAWLGGLVNTMEDGQLICVIATFVGLAALKGFQCSGE